MLSASLNKTFLSHLPSLSFPLSLPLSFSHFLSPSLSLYLFLSHSLLSSLTCSPSLSSSLPLSVPVPSSLIFSFSLIISVIICFVVYLDYRKYGVPTVRVDIAAPKIRRVNDRTNYGDESNAWGLLNPSIFSNKGVYEVDLLSARSMEEVRKCRQRF